MDTCRKIARALEWGDAMRVASAQSCADDALGHLVADDPDGASQRNGVGLCQVCQDGHDLYVASPRTLHQERRVLSIVLHHWKQAGLTEAQAADLRAVRKGIDALRAASIDIKSGPNKYAGWCAAKVAPDCVSNRPKGSNNKSRKVDAYKGRLARVDGAQWRCVCAPCATILDVKQEAKQEEKRASFQPTDPANVNWRQPGSNKYGGACCVCNEQVAAHKGVLGRHNGRWVTGHTLCAFPPKDDGPKGTPADTPAADDTAFQFGANVEPSPTDASVYLDALPEATRNALMPFQVESVQWGAPRSRMLFGHEMGLGKTLIALCLIDASKGALVVGPACVQRNWEAEVKRWRPDLMVTCVDRRGFRWPRRNEVVIARWTSLPVANLKAAGRNQRGLERAKVIDAALVSKYGAPPKGTTVIADETHYAKNAKAQRHQAFRSVSRAVRRQQGRLIGLTGTPLLNNPAELRSILEVLGLLKEAFGDRDTFHRLYDMSRNRWGGWDYGRPEAEAADLLRTVMMRRLSQDVLHLPPIEYDTITVPLNPEATDACDALLSWAGSAEHLEVLMEDAIHGRGGEKVANLFRKLSAMRRAVAVSKVTPLLDILKGNGSETPAVFSCHRAPVEVLAEQGWGTITGDDSAEAKYDTACRFQDGELPGIAYTLAGCEGLNLTRATRLYVASADWTPARNQQAIMRLWRIGQTGNVKVSFLVGEHIVERILHKCLERKRQLLADTGLTGSK